MKTVAVIKNELFKDYLKVVSTDNLEQTLDNPAVPVPFVCVAAVQNPNSEKIAAEINKFFEHRKLNGKDFLAMGEEDVTQLHFLFNLVQLSSGGESLSATVAPVATVSPSVEKQVKVAKPVATVIEEVAPVVVEEPSIVESIVVETVAEVVEPSVETAFVEEVQDSADYSEVIEALGIPKNSIIQFIKNEDVTATILDEKTVVLDGEELPIVDATKKAFKKAGVTGMALGLPNWNYQGTSLKALKDKK